MGSITCGVKHTHGREHAISTQPTMPSFADQFYNCQKVQFSKLLYFPTDEFFCKCLEYPHLLQVEFLQAVHPHLLQVEYLCLLQVEYPCLFQVEHPRVLNHLEEEEDHLRRLTVRIEYYITTLLYCPEQVLIGVCSSTTKIWGWEVAPRLGCWVGECEHFVASVV